MTPKQLERLGARLTEFLDHCIVGGRSERRESLRHYVRGLLLDGERKSIVPIAARLCDDPLDVEGMRQRLQQAVSVCKWDETELFKRIALRVESELPDIDALVIDDTGFPKKGKHSVGVQRQYSGTLGRIDNCQVATSLHLASAHGGACIGMRLFLPEAWANDAERRRKAGVPEDVTHVTKNALAIRMIDNALGWGLAPRPVVADAGYGDSTEFRKALDERGLHYVLRVSGTAVVWPPATCPSPPPPKPAGRRGRQRTKWIAPEGVKPVAISTLAESLPTRRFRRIRWCETTRGRRFAAVRIRTAHRHGSGEPPSNSLWLLCEWSFSKEKPTAFYLSNLPPRTTRKRLVYLAKLRWRIERDYQEMKGQLGLDHFEGRTWGGFHHHVASVAAAHAFLTLHRALFPPEQPQAIDAAEVPRAPADRSASNARPLPNVRPTRASSARV